MNLEKTKEILKNEPAFRQNQAKTAIFCDLINNWSEAATLPKELRGKLEESCPVQEIKAEKILASENDLTIKPLFKLKDGWKIESVLMKHQDGRQTVCVSSQVGCAIGCQFCATGQQGFKRNLTVDEILEQVLFFARLVKKLGEKITGVVFMGMGEPFLNYDNVLAAIKILNDKDGLNIGARHISISTCGVVEGIKKLTNEKLPVNLAISVHAKAFPLEKILAAVDVYVKKTKRRVMFEYLMIDGVNDSPSQAKELAKLLKNRLCFVNLISFNPIKADDFRPSPGWKIKEFKRILGREGVTVTQRYRFGREINAACGQLAA